MISVGNVVAGGAGKTQVVLLLAEYLAPALRMAILSRGYRGLAEHAKHPLRVDVERHSPRMSGDEPWLLASRLRDVPVIVNKNRFKCAVEAEKLGAEIVVLDDGMQHRQFHRDFEIVVIDGKVSLRHFLPKGVVREDLQRLKITDLVVYIGDPDKEIEKTISDLTAAPYVVARIKPSGVFDLADHPIDTLQGKNVAVFCGIGNPSRFVRTVEELGGHVVASHFSADHKIMNVKSLYKFALLSKERGATWLLCTEKDKIKLSQGSLPLPVAWIKVNLEIVKNRHLWEKAVNELKLLVARGPSP